MFTWIRQRVRAAFLAGAADAAHDLGIADDADSDADAADKMRVLLAAAQPKALPAPDESKPVNRVAGKIGNGKPVKVQ